MVECHRSLCSNSRQRKFTILQQCGFTILEKCGSCINDVSQLDLGSFMTRCFMLLMLNKTRGRGGGK